MSDDRIKSKLGYEYSLKDALRHNPTIIMAGDNISAVALARIEELEAKLAKAVGALQGSRLLMFESQEKRAFKLIDATLAELDRRQR